MPEGYVAHCQTPNCVGNVFLPVPTPPESFDVQPYSPTGTWPLLFACPLCSHGSTYLRDDFQSETRPVPAQVSPDDEVVWFLELQCSGDNCRFPLRLHTTAASNSASDDVARTIYPAIEGFRCQANHQQHGGVPRGVIQSAQTRFQSTAILLPNQQFIRERLRQIRTLPNFPSSLRDRLLLSALHRTS